MLKLKIIKSELTKMQCLLKLKKWLVATQVMHPGSVNRSAEPLGAHWDEEMTNK